MRRSRRQLASRPRSGVRVATGVTARVGLLVALAVVTAACGGGQRHADAFPPSDGSAFDELFGGGGLSAEEAERLAVSAQREAAGDYVGAVEILDVDGSGSPSWRIQRMLRVRVIAERSMEAAARGAAWSVPASDPPLAHALRADLDYLDSWRRFRRAAYSDEPFSMLGHRAPEAWVVLEPSSVTPLVDFDRFGPAELAAEHGRGVRSYRAVPEAHGARIAWRGDGLYLAETHLEVDREVAGTVLVRSFAGYRLWIDGVEVARRDLRDGYAPDVAIEHVELSAGRHHLVASVAAAGTGGELHLVLDDALASSVVRFGPTLDAPDVASSVRGATPHGAASVAPWLASARATPTRWLALTDLAWWLGDAEAAEAALYGNAPAVFSPSVALAANRLAEVASTVRPVERREGAIRALQRAVSEADELDAEPAAVFLELGWRQFEQGSLESAAELAERALDGRSTLADAYALRAAVDEYQGLDLLAHRARRQALARAPLDCGLLTRWLSRELEDDPPTAQESLPDDWLRCDETLSLVAEQILEPRGQTDDALAIARRLALRNPNDPRHAMRWIALAERVGNDDELVHARDHASAHLASLEDLDDWEIDYALRAESVDRARQAIDRVVRRSASARTPHLLARRALQRAYLSGQPPLAELTVDVEQAARAFEESGASYEGDAVYVVDYGAFVFLPNGGRLDVVQQLVRLQSREALEAYGEVAAPQGAKLLAIRTIKRDGEVLVPERIGARDAISMPNLEIGDFVELSYATWSAPEFVRSAAVRTPRFYLATPGVPMHWSELRVIAPTEWAEHVVVDARGEDAFELSRREQGTRTIWQVSARGATAPVLENRAPEASEWLPSVRFAHAFAWEDVCRGYRELIARASRPSRRILALSRELAEGARGPLAQAERILRFVVDDREHAGGFLHDRAAWGATASEADRLALAWALLRAARIDADLIFVRPHDRDATQSEIPDASLFDLTAVRVTAQGETAWFEPEYDFAPFDYLRPEAQGTTALIIASTATEDGCRFVETPTWPASTERHAIELRVELARDGAAHVDATERVPVSASAEMRQLLEDVDDPAELVGMLEGGLSSSFPGVQVRQLSVAGEERVDAQLALQYTAAATALLSERDDTLQFEGVLFPRAVGRAFARTAERELDLVITRPLRESMTVTYRAPEGYQFASAPAPVERTWDENHFSRTAWIEDDGRTLRLERRIDVPVQRVAADEYPSFAAWAHDVESYAIFRFSLAPSTEHADSSR